MPNTHEQKFTNALRDIFVGAKIEGDSGYINLMRIKSRYYTEGVFPKLMAKIDAEIKPFPAFREELFDKLYTFFKRYFSESGSIYFRHTPYYQDIYERIYTDDRDVMLFWKTQNLYYVKTDRLFRSLTLELSTNHTKDTKKKDENFSDDSCDSWTKFFFDASNLQNKRNNEKRNLVFSYEGVGENDALKFAVNYSQGATKTKVEDILKAIKKDGVKVNEDQLTRAFSLFERQSEVDFFINKNAKAFLNEQFDLWMYQYLFKNDSTDWNDKRIKQMQALKRTAYAIIEFIAQFEDELVRIWNKPKFALASNYVITFDRVFGKSEVTARKLLTHEGIRAQIDEWKQLGIIDDDFTVEHIYGKDEELSAKNTKDTIKDFDLFRDVSCDSWTEEDLSTKNTKETKEDSRTNISEKYRFLPFDTKHFKSLEIEILALFDNLDEELDGRLVHSENYQALNTLKDKFREKVKCIYIDPPYNTGSDGFSYKDQMKHSSWISMMSDRTSLSRETLSQKGVLFSSIDAKERDNLEFVCKDVFGVENRVEELIWVQNTTHNQSPTYSTNHEYVEVFAKDLSVAASDFSMFRETKAGFPEIMELVEKLNPEFPPISEIEKQIRELMTNHLRDFKDELESEGLTYNEETKKTDDWRGIYNYRYAEYRDADGKYIEESIAESENAKIWVWREDNPSMPSGKQSPTTREESEENYRFYKPKHPITKKEVMYPKRGWVFPKKLSKSDSSRKSFESLDKDKRVVWGEDEKKIPQVKKFLHETETNVAKSVFHDYTDGEKQVTLLFGEVGTFPNPKPTTLVEKFISQVCENGEMTFDFFGGSGTTAHAVINLNREDGGRRKYILVEANDYFHTVILPRVKKVVFSDKWKDGKAKPDGKGVSHFCKYFALEQYEDTLRRAAYVNDSESDSPSFFDNPFESAFSAYVFLRDKKMSDALKVDYEADKITVDFAKLYPEIDWAETLSCVKGKFIKTITAESVTFADGETVKYAEMDYRDILPLIWWDK